MIEAPIRPNLQPRDEIPQAFRPEFYQEAGAQQIKDDVKSFLGEYRFEVPDHPYSMGFSEEKLVDPNTRESMSSKAQKAIELKKAQNLSSVREEAELEGFFSLESQLREAQTGTIVWFSPPGAKEDGYGDYGFAYTGKKEGDIVKMNAIRLESPSITDFNIIAGAMWGQQEEMGAEYFLKTPMVLDIPEDKAWEFIQGVFEIKPKEDKVIFEESMVEMGPLIDEASVVLRYGTDEEKRLAIAVLENRSIELKSRFSNKGNEKTIYLSDFKPLKLDDALNIPRYISPPPLVAGSCGMSGKIEGSNFLGKMLSSPNSLTNKENQEWFSCPKCAYKADGPVGNRCPGCGLTKEQFAKEGGEACD